MIKGLTPMHPGALLREDVLPSLGIGKAAMARDLNISRSVLYDILDEKAPVTAQMALRLGKLCGNGPDLWINLQSKFDLHIAAQQFADELAEIPLRASA